MLPLAILNKDETQNTPLTRWFANNFKYQKKFPKRVGLAIGINYLIFFLSWLSCVYPILPTLCLFLDLLKSSYSSFQPDNLWEYKMLIYNSSACVFSAHYTKPTSLNQFELTLQQSNGLRNNTLDDNSFHYSICH